MGNGEPSIIISRQQDRRDLWEQLTAVLQTPTLPMQPITVHLDHNTCEVDPADALAFTSAYHTAPPPEPPFWQQSQWRQGVPLHRCTTRPFEKFRAEISAALQMIPDREATEINAWRVMLDALLADAYRVGVPEAVLETMRTATTSSTPFALTISNEPMTHQTNVGDHIAALRVLVVLYSTKIGLQHLADPALRPPGITVNALRSTDPHMIDDAIDDIVAGRLTILHAPEILERYGANGKYEPQHNALLLSLHRKLSDVVIMHELTHYFQHRAKLPISGRAGEARATQASLDWFIGVRGPDRRAFAADLIYDPHAECLQPVAWDNVPLTAEESQLLIEYYSPCSGGDLDARAWELARDHLSGTNPSAHAEYDARFTRIYRTMTRRIQMSQIRDRIIIVLTALKNHEPVHFAPLGISVATHMELFNAHAPLYARYRDHLDALTDPQVLFQYIVLHESVTALIHLDTELRATPRARDMFDHELKAIDRLVDLNDAAAAKEER